MPEPEYRRIRVYFEKTGDSRFLSHLDLMRTMERAIRRSGLPVRFTEGMNPHVRMSFPTALPLGLPSRLETMEIQVAADVTVRQAIERLAAELPEGLRPFDGDVCFAGEKWSVVEQIYEVRGSDLPGTEGIAEFLARPSIPVTRREKVVDLKPLVTHLAREGDVLLLSIAWTDSGTARPEDVISAFGRDPGACSVLKVGMSFATSGGDRIRKVHEPQDPR